MRSWQGGEDIGRGDYGDDGDDFDGDDGEKEEEDYHHGLFQFKH